MNVPEFLSEMERLFAIDTFYSRLDNFKVVVLMSIIVLLKSQMYYVDPHVITTLVPMDRDMCSDSIRSFLLQMGIKAT